MLFVAPFILLFLWTATSVLPQAETPQPAKQQVRVSRYLLQGPSGPEGYTELTELRRPDGSKSFLARERMEFWGPVLERFVVLTYDAQGRFDSGHWVGTSEYSPDFTYTFRSDGKTIRGDWQGSIRGKGWSEVPVNPRDPLMGFWGPLESLLLMRFETNGPDRQRFTAVDVEDSHHRLLETEVNRLGPESIVVPAGTFQATHFTSERFGTTHHWLDHRGDCIRWLAEDGRRSWELEVEKRPFPLPRQVTVVATGRYLVSSSEGGPAGQVSWKLAQDDDGNRWIEASEDLDRRKSRLEGRLDPQGNWLGSSERVDWLVGEGKAAPEIQHLETFFYRDKVHLLRFRDRAYPLLQSRAVTSPVPFYLVNYPFSAALWLRNVELKEGVEQQLPQLLHIANRFRGGGLELQPARVRFLGRTPRPGGGPEEESLHFELRYPGGWLDSRFEFWTDQERIPLLVKAWAEEGEVEYRLQEYEKLISPLF